MKKRIIFISLLCFMTVLNAMADSYWKNTFALGQEEEWYGSDEAKRVAENVLLYQRNSGGWPKNVEIHEELTEQQKNKIISQKSELSCFDNGATTTEMRFLARVYRHVPDSRYREAFNRGLNCILEAQSICGNGWSQYWPKRGGDAGTSYSDFITFNDNVIVNILKMLQDVMANTGDFAEITEESTRLMARESFDKGVQCILDCQIRNDEGELTVWCAQHDPTTLLPAVARNYEMPSYSGCESATILMFLMSLENPSDAIRQAVEGGVKWYEENAMENKAIEDFVNDAGEQDRRIVDAEGQKLWGRFVQIGGEIGRQTYEALFKFLEENGGTRTVVHNGVAYKYRDVDNARNSYNPDMADKPIFCPKTSDEGCSYRFAYSYNDTEPVADANGVPMRTSLNTYDRTTYTFAGTWGNKLVNAYKKWKQDLKDNCVVYAIQKDDTFASGTVIELENISLTYGETGGPDFLKAISGAYDNTFVYYTPGNNVNGNKTGGTFYTFRPEKEGTLSVHVKHNVAKPLYLEEDGTVLPEYNGVSFDSSHPSAYTISIKVKAGSAYKIYCEGSKLGFYGFTYEWSETTGIGNITAGKETTRKGVFSLNGQKLTAPRRGINIINGKKVIIK